MYESIVFFIHGLTGNRENTWSYQNGCFWPRQILPVGFPTARIRTLGYDADVARIWARPLQARSLTMTSVSRWRYTQQRHIETRAIIFVATA